MPLPAKGQGLLSWVLAKTSGHCCTQELLHTPLWKPLAPRELTTIHSFKRGCTEQEVLQPTCEAAQAPVHTLARELRLLESVALTENQSFVHIKLERSLWGSVVLPCSSLLRAFRGSGFQLCQLINWWQ